MTIFTVETYVVKPEKTVEFTAWVKKWEAFTKKRPKMFKEVKSYKVFSNMLGGIWGGGVWMSEYESLADLEKLFHRMMADKASMTMMAEWNALIIPGTYSINVWAPVP